jgi:hypothetical protein
MRTALHALASALMWGVFGWYWYVVGQRQIDVHSLQAVGLLAAISLAGVLVTLWWVRHNKRLASRNRRTNPPPTRPEEFGVDTIGREIAAPELASLRAAQVVRISVDDEGRKVYAVDGGGA